MKTLRRNTKTVLMLALASLALAQCLDRAKCDELRQELYEKKSRWARCEIDADCVEIGGNPKDCTGVLACPFVVGRAHREEAERAMLSSADDSVECHLCSTPMCAESAFIVCEPVTHQCILTGGTFDGGGPPPVVEGGPPEPGTPDASDADDAGPP